MLKKLKVFGAGKREKKEIIINIEPLETRVAVLEDGRLDNFHIERKEDNRIVGSIFKGKIQNLEDGLQAAFVDIGLKKNAFIHYWDMIPEDAARLEREEGVRAKSSTSRRKKYKPGEMQKLFPVGSEIIVQVTKDAIGTKGPRVTANLSIPGRFLVMMPGTHLKGISRKIDDVKERNRLKKVLARLPVPENLGLIVRTAGSGTRKVSFARDARTLFEIWNDIEKGMKETPAPCCLYSEPRLAERVVRDYLTEDVDRIYIDNRDMYEATRQIIAKFSRRSRNWVQLYGGEEPIFSADGRTVHFRYGNRFYSTPILEASADGARFRTGRPEVMVEGAYSNVPGLSYDVGPDGRLLLLRTDGGTERPNHLNVILNWRAGLER